MARRIYGLAALTASAALLGCQEPMEGAPIPEAARAADEAEAWEEDLDEVLPDEEMEEEEYRPTCHLYMLREGEDRVSFLVDVEGAPWTAVALFVQDEHVSWRVLQDGDGATFPVPFDLGGRWTVEMTVYGEDGDSWPCGSASAVPAP
jgi:hypothetical protein